MIKNESGQAVSAQLVAVADGEDVTSGTTTVYVTGDAGTQASGGGTVTHEGNGCWSYQPTQAETDYDHVSYTFVNTAAISVTVQRDPITLADYKATGFSTLDAAGVRTAVGLASANLDTQLGDIPTVSEFEARTIAAADYFDPANDPVANVTLVATCTTNTDMRGTDGANTTTPNTVAPDNATIAAIAGYLDTEIAAIKAKTDNLPSDPADQSLIIAATDAIAAAIAALEDISVADILTAQMTESYAAKGAAPTLAQSLFWVQQVLTELSFSGTTGTVKKLDGSTTAGTLTLDNADDPTSLTRAT
jgi:hypothetical protein